tara:strand:- start:1130 stop:1843 length:714 start_codon:yes stop_codon:yes gene_type:complete
MEITLTDRTCVITGVGWGTGKAIACKFANSGYSVAMLARRSERLEQLENEIENAYAYPCDVADAEALEETLKKIAKDLGHPCTVVHNAVSGAWGTFMEIEPSDLEKTFQVNTMALLHLARFTLPKMMEVGNGSLICTGNTAAHRGRAGYAAFAPTKAAQRILAQSIAREAGPKGVHVAYITIDAVIDLRWTRKRYPDKSDDFFIKPDEIADEVFHVVNQPKGAWSFDVEIRPNAENW